ncbi:hypothetical protein F6V30_12250 [Oryzomonas sagensis]|uniref:Lipoprotein n=1 Tax=Oryzomonas sagensis TaxID=2603857 RepID=A0ABQ6TM92_9BACT|nr:hypothetical protein [Oryzomonas sagensis]KAB0669569.1 hypothetical protein F6V30_12250 [Oryzomonas sagensis]
MSNYTKYIAAIVLLLVLPACATTSTTVVDEEVVTNKQPMATYKSLVIRNFELNRELYTSVPEGRMGERERRYAQMPAEFAEQIERYVRSRHTYQDVARDGQVTGTTLVLKGRFTRIGRFRISITATLYDGATGQEVAYFRQTLWDVFDTSETLSSLAREVADFIDRIQYK